MDIETEKIETITLQRFQIGIQNHLAAELPGVAHSAKFFMQHSVDRLVVGIKAYCMAQTHEAQAATVNYYKTWFDQFRAECFPFWLRKIFPPNMVEETVFEPITVRVCPHIVTQDTMRHVRWAAYGDQVNIP